MESQLIQVMKQNDPGMIREFIGKARLEKEILSRDKFVHMVQCATLNGHHIPHFETTLNLLSIPRVQKNSLKF
jgi:hypothetical protein|tara:strand:- start:3522 stop:3740 length:219 start_codon:yes stop_codon:yes gene_type:complete